MFDDPRRELNRLQRELLAEEEFDEAYEDEELADILAMLEERDEPEETEPLYRNYANGYGGKIRNYANDYGRAVTRQLAEEEPEPDYEEYWEDDDRMVYADEDDEDDRAVYRDYGRKPAKKAKKEPREKGVRGLVILACLEMLAILGILGWWTIWLM
ncbi:MAG: hypothetical protein IJ001_07630 [Oscillospiraceae bacterium]|nr:hypothetical protein [Oscillospiraceae bacterium]